MLLKFSWNIHSTLKTRSSTKFWFTTIRCSSELNICARTWISWWWAGDEVCCERWPAFSSLGICGKRSLLTWSLGWASLPWGGWDYMDGVGIRGTQNHQQVSWGQHPQSIEKVNSHHCCWNFWNYDIFYFSEVHQIWCMRNVVGQILWEALTKSDQLNYVFKL